MAFFFLNEKPKYFIAYIDSEYFNESIREIYSNYYIKEDWVTIPRSSRNLNYSWIKKLDSHKIEKIAHGLGGAGSLSENSIRSFEISNRLGFNFFEVDIWLTAYGDLRCHHGPEPPPPPTPEACTLTTILKKLNHENQYIIIDSKTEFFKTANVILKELAIYPDLQTQVIFQLYKPQHVAYFLANPHFRNFPGPILTLYRSTAPAKVILESAQRIGIKAIAIDINRLKNLTLEREKDMIVFTHPIHDCAELLIAKNSGVNGVYTVSRISCSS